MNIKAKIAALAVAAGLAGFVSADSINGVRTDVVPGEWTSSFAAAKAYAEANGVPLFVFFASSSCSHCNAVKSAINSAEFVAWRQSRKIIMVAVDDNVQVKNFAKGAARWLQANKTGKYPYMRIYWPAGGVDVGCNGYPYNSIPGAGSTTQARIMNMIDTQLAKWISGGGDAGGGTTVDPTPDTPSTPVVGTEWKRARKLNGSFYDSEGRVAGRVIVSAGKVNAKGVAKIKAQVMGQNGRLRTIPAKSFTVDSTTKGTISGVSGTYAFEITGSRISGNLVIGDEKYTVTSAVTGGSLTAGTYEFDLDSFPTVCQKYPVIEPELLLPLGQTFTSTATKWTFPRKSVSIKYDSKTGEFEVTKISNPSGLKLSYKSSTGYFKGPFTVYTENGTRQKRYTANVTGFMVGDTGYGVATIKNVGSYPCTIGLAD